MGATQGCFCHSGQGGLTLNDEEVVDEGLHGEVGVENGKESPGLDTSLEEDTQDHRGPQACLPSEALRNSRILDEASIRGLQASPSPVDGGSHSPAESRARELLWGLRVCEAAAQLEAEEEQRRADGMQPETGGDLREALDMQLRALTAALERLAGHPGLQEVSRDCDNTDTLTPSNAQAPSAPATPMLGVSVPASPASLRSAGSAEAQGKRDMLEINFDLDEHGRRVEAVVEFFADGSVSIEWTAFDLPVPMAHVLCLVQEVDLLSEVVPFVVSSGVLHQFPWNEADRLVRVASKPPIPFVAGLEGVSQRFGFDLLDTPWGALCLVELGPEWQQAPDAGAERWRQVPRPPPFQKGYKQVDVKSVVALGRPAGPEGELSTILFSGKGHLKVPRRMLPNWLVTWLVKTTGRLIYQQALERVATFDSSKFGPRLRGSSFYAELHRRIAQFANSKAAAASKIA